MIGRVVDLMVMEEEAGVGFWEGEDKGRGCQFF